MKHKIIFAAAWIMLMALAPVSTMAQKSKIETTIESVKDRIDPASIAGIRHYDAHAMVKVLKIRRAVKKNEVNTLVEQYNKGLKGLKGENLGLLAGLGSSVKDIIENKDFKTIWSARGEYQEQVQKVQKEYRSMHSDMESDLLEILTRRQARKWNKYQDRLHRQDEAAFDIGDLFSQIGL